MREVYLTVEIEWSLSVPAGGPPRWPWMGVAVRPESGVQGWEAGRTPEVGCGLPCLPHSHHWRGTPETKTQWSMEMYRVYHKDLRYHHLEASNKSSHLCWKLHLPRVFTGCGFTLVVYSMNKSSLMSITCTMWSLLRYVQYSIQDNVFQFLYHTFDQNWANVWLFWSQSWQQVSYQQCQERKMREVVEHSKTTYLEHFTGEHVHLKQVKGSWLVWKRYPWKAQSLTSKDWARLATFWNAQSYNGYY